MFKASSMPLLAAEKEEALAISSIKCILLSVVMRTQNVLTDRSNNQQSDVKNASTYDFK